MQSLRQAISNDAFLLDLEATSIEQVFARTLRHLVDRGFLAPEESDAVELALLEREREASTAIGYSVAVPHCYLDLLREPLVVFVRLERPINLGAPDGIPTRFMFLLLGPAEATVAHLDTLANIARLMVDDEFRYELGVAQDSTELLAALDRFVERTTPPRPTPERVVSPGLVYTGRIAGGLLGDVRRRGANYVADFRDGVSRKTLPSVLFLFFACLAPAVTFGGVMAAQTEGHIGAVEMIAASALCGTVFALIGGQPLIILGGTGPLLVFTVMLFRLCGDLEIPFLPTYACVGLWTAVLVVLLAITDASCLMRYFTRFTDEIFAALISLLFIYEAVKALVEIFHDLDVKMHHDTALLSLLLALGTFYIAISLSGFRRSRYLLPWMREFLADFGPAIALVAMTGVAVWLHEVDLDVLPAPDRFGTTTGRGWLVSPFELPTWVWLAAIVPAMLAAVLVFLDQNISARLINSPSHHLQKGEAYHLDLAVVGSLIGICSVLGMPWLVAATVRSLNHLRSLATVEEAVTADGERHDHVIHVQENRVTGLSIHLLIGLALLVLPLLKTVPMAVLYGLFLFMGVASLKGNQFFERLCLWLMDSSLYPATHYMRRVPNWTIHRFTILQACCLAVLWIVKTSVIGILFPLFVALLVPVRMLAGQFFGPVHLAALDAEEIPEDEANRRTE